MQTYAVMRSSEAKRVSFLTSSFVFKICINEVLIEGLTLPFARGRPLRDGLPTKSEVRVRIAHGYINPRESPAESDSRLACPKQRFRSGGFRSISPRSF